MQFQLQSSTVSHPHVLLSMLLPRRWKSFCAGTKRKLSFIEEKPIRRQASLFYSQSDTCSESGLSKAMPTDMGTFPGATCKSMCKQAGVVVNGVNNDVSKTIEQVRVVLFTLSPSSWPLYICLIENCVAVERVKDKIFGSCRPIVG